MRVNMGVEILKSVIECVKRGNGYYVPDRKGFMFYCLEDDGVKVIADMFTKRWWVIGADGTPYWYCDREFPEWVRQIIEKHAKRGAELRDQGVMFEEEAWRD